MTQDVDAARRRLAKRLRDVRRAAGLSGEQLADACGWSQSKVSKIETGRVEQTLTSVAGWRKALHGGRGRMQARIARIESAASVVRTFQPLIVPGLLQSAEYARRLFAFATPAMGTQDTAEALKGRLERQSVLFDLRKRFEFVIGEAGLRWKIAPPEVMRGQLDRLASLIGLPNIDISVIPLDATADVLLYHGFVIFGDPGVDEDAHVSVETLTDDLTIRDAEKVATYLDEFAKLRAAAVSGEDAVRMLMAIATR